MTTFNETFKPFLNKLSNWIASGCNKTEDNRFCTFSGICYNYEMYLKNECFSSTEIIEACKELNTLFRDEGFNPIYPFNANDYFIESKANSIFENEKRLAWIESHK